MNVENGVGCDLDCAWNCWMVYAGGVYSWAGRPDARCNRQFDSCLILIELLSYQSFVVTSQRLYPVFGGKGKPCIFLVHANRIVLASVLFALYSETTSRSLCRLKHLHSHRMISFRQLRRKRNRETGLPRPSTSLVGILFERRTGKQALYQYFLEGGYRTLSLFRVSGCRQDSGQTSKNEASAQSARG